VSVASGATKVSWAEVVRRSAAAMSKLRAELARVIRDPSTFPDIREQLCLWLDVCSKEVDFGDVTPALQDSCYEADDVRLATMPFSSYAVPVRSLPMAPLPAPPDQSCVPPFALDWGNCIKPYYFGKLLERFLQMRARLRFALRHGTFAGAPAVEFLAFGLDGVMDWAARLLARGNTIVRVGGRLRLKDCSTAPETHWNRAAMAHALRDSQDYGLCDAVLTHGMSYLADLAPIVMIADHLGSLCDGFESVHKELARLADKGWYQVFLSVRLDEGKLDLPCLPLRCVPHGSVARKLEPDRFRRIVDNGQPRRVRFTLGARQRVISMADACGWDEGKAIRRAALSHVSECDGGQHVDQAHASTSRATSRNWLRHSPAFRRAQVEAQLGPLPPVPVATSKTPAQVRQMELAAHGDEGRAQAAVAAHGLLPRHPPQLMPLFTDMLLDMCILAYAAFVLGVPLLGFGDDESDAFHQFMSMLSSMWQCGILMLDPHAVLAMAEEGTLPPELAVILEGCMSMGTPPSSGYTQRINTELGLRFETDFHESEARYVKLLRACNSRFDDWVAAREGLAERTGRPQCFLLRCIFFADDPIVLCAGGVAMTVRALVAWSAFMGPRGVNMLMGKAIKRELGVSLGWIGGRVLLPALLGYITGDRQARTLSEIGDYLAGRMTCDALIRHTGLLNHLVCLLALPYHIMYGIYEVHDAIRLGRLPGHALAPRLERAVASFERWRVTISTRSGTSALAAAFVVRAAPDGVAMVRMFSDASKKGTTMPGICGNLYRKFWIIRLEGCWLELPIVVTEFFGGIFNLIVFDSDLGDAPVALVLDALVVPIVMASKASDKSPMMQWMHALLLGLPEFARHEHHLFAGQTYGPRNLITDAGSRGRQAELEDILRHFGLQPQDVSCQLPPRIFDMLDSAVAFLACADPG
jgi:hypothetical protein